MRPTVAGVTFRRLNTEYALTLDTATDLLRINPHCTLSLLSLRPASRTRARFSRSTFFF